MGNGTDLIIRLLVDDEDLDKVDRSQAKFDGWNDALGESSKIAAGTLIAIGGAAVGASIAYADAQAGVDNLAGSLGLVPDQAEAAGEAAANAYADAFGGSLEEVQATVGGIIGSIGEMRNMLKASSRLPGFVVDPGSSCGRKLCAGVIRLH